MKQSRLIVGTAFFAFLCALATFPGAAHAQQNGYINGSITLFSFNPGSGAIVNSFYGAGSAEPFAVEQDDATILTLGPFDYGLVNEVSGRTGQLEGSVAVYALGWNGLALSPDGTKAYVTTHSGVDVIDTATLSVGASIAQNFDASDVALSPDGSTLYVAMYCADACEAPISCPVLIGICAFNTDSLALEWYVKNVAGLLSVSDDGSMLYSAGFVFGNSPAYPLNAINTSTRAVTNLEVPAGKAGNQPVRIITDPASHYAVVIEQPSTNSYPMAASAYLLNTSTNKFVQTLFSSAPGGMAIINSAGAAAFAPNGKSVWMLLSCGVNAVPNCSDESGQIYLAGFSIPSGAVISYQAVPGQFWDNADYKQSIAFPR
jgi:YVTN family beta-propeller protein